MKIILYGQVESVDTLVLSAFVPQKSPPHTLTLFSSFEDESTSSKGLVVAHDVPVFGRY
ncbi:predicted protein [Plenodomus lingam JN3]|uniref:Predicted protein n=1 Tax=Leptosphaeria maculans (strain JN3 / isolate v23.1.3 / race Av1-4-5-6-7-8) TaxID=985895 RepID=E4ZWM4_LEPMJ|nr:predicted protein [Plenodomus lingam JN3]CBX96000.1 predicted protein [Plenodomus lingam JN3]